MKVNLKKTAIAVYYTVNEQVFSKNGMEILVWDSDQDCVHKEFKPRMNHSAIINGIQSSFPGYCVKAFNIDNLLKFGVADAVKLLAVIVMGFNDNE